MKKVVDQFYKKILIAINPVLPHFSSECMELLNIKERVLWPKIDNKVLLEDNIKFIIQFNGKTRKIIISKKDTSEDMLLAKIREDNKLKEYLLTKQASGEVTKWVPENVV